MAAHPGDFDEFPEHEFSHPLPPEDRLWRHPSELGRGNASLPLDQVAVRRRWLNQQPSRASAWTAGVVGAVLATGLVALGTHLAGAFTQGSGPSTDGGTTAPAATATVTDELGATPRALALGANLASSVTRVGASVAMIDVINGSLHRRYLGLVLRSDGLLVAPTAELRTGATYLATITDTVPAVATVVATDAASGVAVLRVNGVSGLPVADLAASGPLGQQSFALAVTSAGGGSYVLGEFQGLDAQATIGGTKLADVLRTDLPATRAPLGSPLIDAEGDVVGIVAGSEDGMAVAVPSWIAGPVTDQLATDRVVRHGVLGIEGRTVPQEGFQPAGVRLTAVTPGGAAGVAGLRVGDIITSVNFERVTSLVGLRGHLYGLAAGDELMIGIERGTTDYFYRVYLQPRPAPREADRR